MCSVCCWLRTAAGWRFDDGAQGKRWASGIFAPSPLIAPFGWSESTRRKLQLLVGLDPYAAACALTWAGFRALLSETVASAMLQTLLVSDLPM